MRILVAGSRHATATRHRQQISDGIKAALHHRYTPGVLVHGDAGGVDRIAASLAESWDWETLPVPAAWADCDLTVPADLGGCPDWPHRKTNRAGVEYCPYAGNRRNQALVDVQPRAHVVVVFPAGSIEARSGTRDLYRRAIRAGLFVAPPIPLEVDGG